MDSLRAIAITMLISLVAITSPKISASDFYHWVDENGVQHFSQYPPTSDTPNVRKQKLVDTTPPGDGQVEDVFNVEAHQKSMAAWREELEEKRKDAREKNRQNAQQQTRYQRTEPDYSRRYWYPPIYNRPPYRPPTKPQPPIEKPTPPSVIYPPGSGPP